MLGSHSTSPQQRCKCYHSHVKQRFKTATVITVTHQLDCLAALQGLMADGLQCKMAIAWTLVLVVAPLVANAATVITVGRARFIAIIILRLTHYPLFTLACGPGSAFIPHLS